MTDRVWREGMGLGAYAEAWEDMAPHWQQLVHLATPCRRILELGVRGGVSTASFLTGLPPTGELHSVDIDPNVKNMVPRWVREDPRWRLSITDSRAVLPAIDTFDLAFIDTSHTFDQTRLELELTIGAGIPKIVLHDYLDRNYPGVHEAVHDALRALSIGGTDWKLRVFPSRWGLAVLER